MSSSTSNVQTVQVIHAPQMDLGCRKAFNFRLVSPILASNLLFSDKSLKHLLTHTLSLTFRDVYFGVQIACVYICAGLIWCSEDKGARVQTASIERVIVGGVKAMLLGSL